MLLKGKHHKNEITISQKRSNSDGMASINQFWSEKTCLPAGLSVKLFAKGTYNQVYTQPSAKKKKYYIRDILQNKTKN